MFGSASPTITDQDALLLARELLDAYSPDGEPSEFAQLCAQFPDDPAGPTPWEDGYLTAVDLHHWLGGAAGPADAVDIEGILERIGVQINQIGIADPGIRAVALASPLHRPTILVNTASPYNESSAGYRFTLAHELAHFLLDRGFGRQLAITSGAWAPPELEKRANAFAAMFLMPKERMDRWIAGLTLDLGSPAAIYEMAGRAATSYSAMVHHLYNLGLIEEHTRDALLEDRLSTGEER